MNRPEENQPAAVAEGPKQAGEALRQKWHWAEPSVWTDRVLTALENGVKGGKWFSLSDRVEDERNLRSAFWKVRRKEGCPGVDGQSVTSFERHLEMELPKLRKELKENSCQPHPTRRTYIPKPGSKEKRPLRIPVVRDRVVQGALSRMRDPGPDLRARVRRAQLWVSPWPKLPTSVEASRRIAQGRHTWVVDADLKSYFDTIPHDRLMERIEMEERSSCIVLETADGFTAQ